MYCENIEYKSSLTPLEDPFIQIYNDPTYNLLNNNEDSFSHSDYKSQINTIISNKFVKNIETIKNITNIEKFIRLWIPKVLIDYNNIPEQWVYFINHIEKTDEIINNKKMNSEYTSNKKFSLMFKDINDSYKNHCPNEYNLLNSYIILQYRLEFFMRRHTQLLN